MFDNSNPRDKIFRGGENVRKPSPNHVVLKSDKHGPKWRNFLYKHHGW